MSRDRENLRQKAETENEKIIEIPSTIPQPYKEKYGNIAVMIVSFCDEKLDDEYKELCLHALQKLCRKRTEPMATGRDNMWAAGIVYAIAQNCNLVGNRDIFMSTPEYQLSPDVVSSYFGVSKGGMSEKAKNIRKELNITKERDEWVTQKDRGYGGRTLLKMLKKMR